MSSQSYKTIIGRARAELVEKKSRFIAQIAHVETENEALSFLEEVRSENRLARHNVYAYVVRAQDALVAQDAHDAQGGATGAQRIRYSDDGEPSKTAGIPTLEVIQHADLSNVAMVVTRYFGGVLLGTGGLVRAYTKVAQAAVEAAEVVTVQCCVDVMIKIPYALYDQVLHFAQTEQVHVVDSDFSDTVSITVRIPDDAQDRFAAGLRDVIGAQGTLCIGDAFDACL